MVCAYFAAVYSPGRERGIVRESYSVRERASELIASVSKREKTNMHALVCGGGACACNACACACACVCMCVRAYACVCIHIRVCVYQCVRAFVHFTLHLAVTQSRSASPRDPPPSWKRGLSTHNFFAVNLCVDNFTLLSQQSIRSIVIWYLWLEFKSQQSIHRRWIHIHPYVCKLDIHYTLPWLKAETPTPTIWSTTFVWKRVIRAQICSRPCLFSIICCLIAFVLIGCPVTGSIVSSPVWSRYTYENINIKN